MLYSFSLKKMLVQHVLQYVYSTFRKKNGLWISFTDHIKI